jgi:adenylate cyclase
MAEERVQRRLTAILAADMVGYSRLVGADEEGTIARQKVYRAEIIDPEIASNGGRIVKTMGDGLLVEFASVVAAVKTAVAVQQAMSDLEADVSEDRRIRYRVGVNLGDVVIDGDDILGDGVNIAARLESEADVGGICISGDAYRQVVGKIEIAFEDLGELALKNIAEPVRAFRVVLGGGTAAQRPKPLPLPDKPSIAVMPFDNMSGDPDQEYFSDGIVEDIITGLSRFRSLFVVARNSTFTYKDKPVKAQQIADELGVRYMLEGSIRKAGQRVRITAQLINAVTGNHVWAERYDRQLDDLFALQDEITETIVAAIEPEMAGAERRRAMRKRPGNMDAWDYSQQAAFHAYKYTKQGNAEARRLYLQAVELDPHSSVAIAGIANTYGIEVALGWVTPTPEHFEKMLTASSTAVALDEKDPAARLTLGYSRTVMGDHESAIDEFNAAISISPSYAEAHEGLGLALFRNGDYEEADAAYDVALRLSPNAPNIAHSLMMKAACKFQSGHYEEAVDWATRASRRPNPLAIWSFINLAAPLAHLERMDEARTALETALQHNPGFSRTMFDQILQPRYPEHHDYFFELLHSVGLPE